MKYVAAGLTAIAVFFTSYLLLIFLEEPFLDLMGWLELDPYWEMRWWRAAAGLTMAVYVFRAFIAWRNNAALQWRRTLAARARA
ncbi:hypothetical protein [Microvirga sp. TS319]|uniref:hypothetical protein n=1 Tax=Microvirga sp. TS319 TaxID=3241165 RepID=UPI00351A57BF